MCFICVLILTTTSSTSMKKWRFNYLLCLACLSIGLCSCTQHELTPLITISILNELQDCEEQNLNYTIVAVQEPPFRSLEGKIILPIFEKRLDNKTNNELFFPADSKHRMRIKVKGYYLYKQNGLNSFEGCTSAHHFKITEILKVEIVNELYDYPISMHYTPPTAKKVDYCTCDYKNLSKVFDLSLRVTKFRNADGIDSCLVNLIFQDKKRLHPVDSLIFPTNLFLNETFENCNDVRSYTTGYNINKEIVDNMYGDIVVADLNFDGLEDLAIMNDNGGNSGPYYRFFLQENKQKFKESQFLRDSMALFPTKINPANKTLFIRSRVGFCMIGERVLAFNENKKWETKSKKLIDHCKD